MARADFTIDIRTANRGLRLEPSSDHLLCVHLQESGKGRGRVDIVPASFSYVWQSERPARVLLCTFADAYARRVAESMGMTMPAEFVAPLLEVHDPRLFHVASALNHASTAGAANSGAIVDNLAHAIVAQFVRRCSRREFQAKLEDRRLAEILRHIEAHLHCHLRVGELAALGNMKQSRFSMLLRRRFGMSPLQYILRRRTARAITMLCEGQSNLEEVSRKCGFANQSHMTRMVRARAGVTPGTFRK